MNPLDENIAETEDIIEQLIKTQGTRTDRIDSLHDEIVKLEERLQKASEALYEVKEQRESVAARISESKQFVKDEIAARKKVRALVRKYDDLQLDEEASPTGAQIWLGEWEEDTIEYVSTWQGLLSDAKSLVRDL